MSTPKKKGQHRVTAIIRLYSNEAEQRLADMLSKRIHSMSAMQRLDAVHYRLVEIVWEPRPSKNQWNTESDWRREIAKTMEGLYFDVIAIDYSWNEVPE